MIASSPPISAAGQRCTAARRLIVEDGHEQASCSTRSRSCIDRMIVDQPFADPQPFMGPVIDNAAADHVQEQWLNLMMKGGKPLRRLDRPVRRPPLPDPGADRRDRRQGPSRRGDFRACPANHPGQGFRRGDRRSEQHALRPRRQPDRRKPGHVRQVLGQRPRRRHQLEQADQRRAVQRPVRRRRACRATIGRAPSMPPIIAPIRSPAARPTGSRAAIGEGLRDPNMQED